MNKFFNNSKIYNNNNFYIKYNLFTLGKSSYFLIEWQPKMETNIHYHPNKLCYFYLLKGKIKENVYKENKKIKTNFLNKILDHSYIDDTFGKHSIKNISNKTSYSFHIYKNFNN